MSNKEWIAYVSPEETPIDTLLLFKVKRTKFNGTFDFEYETGTFFETSGGGLLGVIGGHFHFDKDLIAYRNIQDLIDVDGVGE